MKHVRNGRQRGFTLVELLVVMLIIGVLVGIAMPQYSEYVRRTHRSNAKAALQQTAQWMERIATAQGRYPQSLPADRQQVEGNRYRLVLDAITNTTFTLRAVRQNGNAQDRCGDLTLTHTGQKGLRNQNSNMTVKSCW